MAGIGGKTYPLSIVVGTVDKATASFERINKQISRLTAPVRRLNNRLAALKEASGVTKVGDAWSAVGGKLGGVLSPLKTLATGFLGIAAAAGLGSHEVLGLVEDQNKIGEAARRVALGIDAYASLTGAAKGFGIEQDEVGSALEDFQVNIVKTRSGIGRFASFLKTVSPAFLAQIKATKSTEQAFLLTADAIKKVKDPAKQATLATMAFGGAGARMVALLKGGSAGVKAAQAEWLRLAGSQEESVKRAMLADDAMDSLGASLQGVKASIVTAAAPAITQIAEKIGRFLTENQGRLAAWAKDFGDKLPAAIDRFVGGATRLINIVTGIWNSIGGVSGVITAFEVFMGVKAVGAVVSLGSALMQTASFGVRAFGVLTGTMGQTQERLDGLTKSSSALGGILGKLGGVAAAGAAGFAVGEGIDSLVGAITGKKLSEHIGDLGGPSASQQSAAFRAADAAGRSRGKGKIFFGNREVTPEEAAAMRANAAGAPPASLLRPGLPPAALPPGIQSMTTTSNAHVTVDFSNMPKGARATADPRDTADLDLSVGYQLAPG